MGKRKFFCAFALLACLFAGAFAQEELTGKYLNIRDSLLSLKSKSELVTEQLNQVSENLKLSQAEAQKWEATSNQLSENLMTINEQLNDCYRTIEKQDYANKCLVRVLMSLITIIVMLLIIKAVFVVLYIKKIPVPRIIDVLA